MTAFTNLAPTTKAEEVMQQDSQKNGEIELFPPTRGEVTPLIDGERAFAEMYDKISRLQAGSYLYMSFWYIQLDTQLKGKDTKGNSVTVTIEQLLKQVADRGVQVRILISKLGCVKRLPFPGAPDKPIGFCPPVTKPAEDLARAMNAIHNKNIKALVTVHPYTASFFGVKFTPGCSHEKLIIVDRRYVFCGGLEFARTYSNADPSHMKPNADPKLHKKYPRSYRHDVHSLIEGPVVKHFEQHFITRWREARSGKDPDVPDLAPPASANPYYDSTKTKHAVQVAITKSVAGSNNFKTISQGVLEAYQTAIQNAEKYIYIENQYFRSQELTDLLIKQLRDKPDLRVILVLPIRSEEDENAFTNYADFIQRKLIESLQQSGRDRFGVFSLRLHWEDGGDLYVHSKVMIVDDKWYTIGSANTNPRSFHLDNEINIVVRDDQTARQLRMDLWKEHMQAGEQLIKQFSLENSKQFVKMWTAIAKANKNRRTLKERAVIHTPPKGEDLPFQFRLFPINPKKFVMGELQPSSYA